MEPKHTVLLVSTFAIGAVLWTWMVGENKDEKKVKKKRKPIRIYMDGCWDLCHSGHYNALRQAKQLGDVLVAGVHTSEEIARNKRWPVMSNEERMACVQACKWVDEVVFDVPYSPTLELIDRKDINCDFVAHGDDMSMAANGQSCFAAVESRLKIFKRTPGVSTTSLIDRLIAAVDDASNSNTSLSSSNSSSRVTRDSSVSSLAHSWAQFLATSQRLASFSNNKTPNKDDKVVYIDGIFDMFHVGHIAALKAAKEQGTFLYVGVFDDLLVKSTILHQNETDKKHFPLMNLQERVLNVLSCKYVDEVIIGCPWNVSNDMIKVLNINTIVTTNITNDELELTNDESMKRFENCQTNGLNIKHLIAKDSQLTTKKLMQRIAKDQERMRKENENRVAKEMDYLSTRKYIQES